jgi:hypothetical protein
LQGERRVDGEFEIVSSDVGLRALEACGVLHDVVRE